MDNGHKPTDPNLKAVATSMLEHPPASKQELGHLLNRQTWAVIFSIVTAVAGGLRYFAGESRAIAKEEVQVQAAKLDVTNARVGRLETQMDTGFNRVFEKLDDVQVDIRTGYRPVRYVPRDGGW